MNALGDRVRTITMVMEWQAEDDPAASSIAPPVDRTPGRRLNPAEASADELSAILRTRVTVVVRPGAGPDRPEEMIGEPLF